MLAGRLQMSLVGCWPRVRQKRTVAENVSVPVRRAVAPRVGAHLSPARLSIVKCGRARADPPGAGHGRIVEKPAMSMQEKGDYEFDGGSIMVCLPMKQIGVL